jgi:hypothetical protein
VATVRSASTQQQQQPLNVETVAARSKVDSRSTGRLPTHRSMTRLNNFDARSNGLHKSMTKLTSSQQNMARSSTQISASAARSITCINHNALSRPATSVAGMGGPSSLTSSTMAASGGYMSGRMMISTGPGASSPTKSMSSGSMSGVVDQAGREIVTVNVNRINEDLIRQVGAVSNRYVSIATLSTLTTEQLRGHCYRPGYKQESKQT